MKELQTADEFFAPKEDAPQATQEAQQSPTAQQSTPAPLESQTNPVPANDGGLPTADDFFKPQKPSIAVDPNPVSSPAIDEFLKNKPVGRIMGAFGSAFAEGGQGGALGIEPGGDVENALKKYGIFNDYSKGQNDIGKAFSEALIRPAAVVLDNEFRGAQAAMGAVGAGIEQTATEIENTSAYKSADVLLQKATHGYVGIQGALSSAAEYFMTTPAGVEVHAIPPDILHARSVGAIGESEASYFGLKEPTPEEALARQHAAEMIPAEALPETPKDIHAIAREVAPEISEKYDALNTQQDTIRTQIADLAAKRDEEMGINPPHVDELQDVSDKIDTILGKVNSVESRLTKRQTANLEDLRTQFDDLSEKSSAAAGADTPEMADLRSQIQQLDYAKRDIAPDVTAAYREAQNRMPEEKATEEAQPTEEKEPTISEEPAAEPAKPIEEQLQSIKDDVSKKLTDVGRPAEESQAASELIAQHYKAIADQGWAKGTPEEIYQRDAANIVAGKERIRRGAIEFNQKARGKIRLATDDAKAAITLFKSADASTFIHETGHHWLDEMMRYAKEDDAPASLLKDRDTVNKWLGVKDGEEIARAQHEKFARGFERYLMEGTAPSKELANVFAKFKQWLTDIYQAVQRLKSPITDDIRDVFDRLLSANPEKTVIAPERELPTAEAPEAAPTIAPQQTGTPTEGTQPPSNVPEAPSATGETSTQGGGTPSSPIEASGEPKGTPEEQRNIADNNVGNENNSSTSGSVNPKEQSGYFIDKEGNLNKDALNYSLYNNTPDWMQNYFNEYTERNRTNFNNEASEVETLSSMQELVKASGWTPEEIRNMEIGQKQNRLQQLASADLFKQMVEDTKVKAAEAAASGDPKKIAEFFEATQEHSLLMQAFRDQKAYAAEASRNLGIRRAIKSITGDAEQFADLFQKITDIDPKDVQKQADFLQKLNLPGTAEKFLKDGAQTPWEKFKSQMLEYYINALISGPITHLRYSIGNALNALWTPLVEVPTAAGIGALREAITGEKITDKVYLGEAGAQLHGIIQGSKNGLMAAADAWKTGVSPALPGEIASPMFATKINKIPGTAGRVINTVSKSVAVIHSFFKAIRYEQNIQGMAYRVAMQEGLAEGTEAFTNRVADLGVNPTKEMMDSATQDALKELYMTPTEYNSFGGKLASAVNSNLAAKIIIPFMKIGSQITRNAFIERTPLGLLTEGARENALYKAGGVAGDTQLAKMATGVALMGGMSALVLEGLATGDGPSDPAKRAIWMLDHTPNSLQIGGITLRYQGLGSLGMLMRFSANMTETASGWNEEEGTKLAKSFMEGLTKSVLDENFMRGLKDLLDAVYHPDEYGANYIKQFATNWLPFSVGMGQVARIADPSQREAHTIMEAAMNKIPFVSEGLEPKRNRFGEVMPNGIDERYAADPVVQRLENLQIGIGKIDKKINGVQLTPQQYDDYSKLAGQQTKMRLNQYVAIPQTRDLPPEIQIKAIHSLIESSRAQARQIVMMNNPDIYKQAAQNKINALTGKK